MTEDPIERPHAVLPPPPSTPDDGPSALEVPPLAAPPASLRPVSAVRGRGKYAFPVRVWAAFVTLFVVGTVVTFLLER
ncbi:MAG TPA: hypothetical protein VMI54_02905 [Polyangiaceae bacterium]|nr:hypothetical protein [Polyangiaceae bacterium]